VQIKPYGVRVDGDTRHVVFQVWEFDGEQYDLAMYFVEDRGGSHGSVRVMRSRYYAIGTGKLMALMEQAGFREVQRIDNAYYQPVLLGKKSRASSA
jgi:hypothetical protein